MRRWEIVVTSENCTGCRICEMICSWSQGRTFHPLSSFIKVKSIAPRAAYFDVIISSACNGCGLCASYCTAGALKKQKTGVGGVG